MKTMTRSIAAFEILFVFPAVLFMTSLVVRSIQPTQYEPAKTAARLIDWFSHHLLLGLYVSLIAMPLMAIALGGLVVLRRWRSDSGLRSDIYGAVAAVRRSDFYGRNHSGDRGPAHDYRLRKPNNHGSQLARYFSI
jgi:hypothetical protein